ncbi:MAG: hypothetical protein HRT68_00610 [Flavobacteriaceae bacterium]|nr:hypothetical protein [Flavobacteriaceae bacterium]
MLLVYTHKITPRVTYVFKQICSRILGMEVAFTSKVEDFVAHNSIKLSYSKKPLGNELFVQSHELLFENGLSDIDINVQQWEETKCFFKVGDKSIIPFDIFAASFYLLSRYEEYLPHVKDEYGRFPAHESLAYKNNFLLKPVVDIWAYKFLEILKEKYSGVNYKLNDFSFQPIFDVPVAYRFKNKGTVRTVFGAARDLVRFDFNEILNRFRVLLSLKRDPYDTFKWIVNVHKTKHIKPLFFFLLADFSNHDRNISYKNVEFRSLIKSVADYADVGLKVSFEALSDIQLLSKEKKRIEGIINKPLAYTRNSFNKINLPNSYRNLIDLEIKEDFTLGYISELGFRAGTCTTFYFYDLDYEIQTPLRLSPFFIMDYLILKEDKQDQLKQMIAILDEVKKVNGKMITIFHNYTFSEDKKWDGFKKLYIEFIKHVTLGQD